MAHWNVVLMIRFELNKTALSLWGGWGPFLVRMGGGRGRIKPVCVCGVFKVVSSFVGSSKLCLDLTLRHIRNVFHHSIKRSSYCEGPPLDHWYCEAAHFQATMDSPIGRAHSLPHVAPTN